MEDAENGVVRPQQEFEKASLMELLPLSEKFDFLLSQGLTIRVYADSRPHILQTMKLQKGAILVLHGRELVEEGLGMGAPICIFRDGARFSLSATTFVNYSEIHPSVLKVYDMNAIESKRFRRGTVSPASYTKHFLRILEMAYRGIRSLHRVAAMMLSVISMMGLRNQYVESQSRGQVHVTYAPCERGLRVYVEFDHLVTEGLRALVIGNEQGGRTFTEYSDALGVKLEGKQIEPWRSTSAEWATLRSPEFGIMFRLIRPDGWWISRGREVVKNRISWSGLNLVYDGMPASKALEYRIVTSEDA